MVPSFFATTLSACLTAPFSGPIPILPLHAEPADPRPGPVTTVFPGPGLVVEKVEGAEAARARAAFAPVVARLGACRPGSGGVIRLTLTHEAGRSAYHVEPVTALDPPSRRCVLEALSTVDVDGISGDGSPSARPPGFTALFRVEW
jgi:hypothetical protein